MNVSSLGFALQRAPRRVRTAGRCSCCVFDHVKFKHVTLGSYIMCKANKGQRQKKKRKCNVGILIGGLNVDKLH